MADSLDNVQDGICVNCVSAPTCAFKMHSKSPIQYCEEFECIDGVCGDAKSSIDYKKYIVETIDTESGLCCNCDYRAECESRGNPEKVLYCEEFA